MLVPLGIDPCGCLVEDVPKNRRSPLTDEESTTG
jgi:hypothetical protein